MFPLIAAVAALGSSLAYAITAVTEQLGTHRVKSRRALSPELLLDLIKQPLWLAGIVANVASFALQVVALRFGPLALVEPILVCDLIFAGLISAALRRHADLVTGAGVVACAAGVAGFLVIARPSAGRQAIGLIQALALLAGFAVVLAGCLALARWNRTAAAARARIRLRRRLCSNGLLDQARDRRTRRRPGQSVHPLADLRRRYHRPDRLRAQPERLPGGHHPRAVLAIITITDTIGDIALGWLFLHEELASGPAAIAGQVASLLVMTVGIVVLAHRSPQVARQQDQTARPADPAPSGPSSSGS